VVNLGWKENFFWKVFEKTGSVSAYLAYKDFFVGTTTEEKKTGLSVKS